MHVRLGTRPWPSNFGYFSELNHPYNALTLFASFDFHQGNTFVQIENIIRWLPRKAWKSRACCGSIRFMAATVSFDKNNEFLCGFCTTKCHHIPSLCWSFRVFGLFWLCSTTPFLPRPMFILVEHKCLIAFVPDTLSVVDTCWESKKILARARLFTKLLSS